MYIPSLSHRLHSFVTRSHTILVRIPIRSDPILEHLGSKPESGRGLNSAVRRILRVITHSYGDPFKRGRIQENEQSYAIGLRIGSVVRRHLRRVQSDDVAGDTGDTFTVISYYGRVTEVPAGGDLTVTVDAPEKIEVIKWTVNSNIDIARGGASGDGKLYKDGVRVGATFESDEIVYTVVNMSPLRVSVVGYSGGETTVDIPASIEFSDWMFDVTSVGEDAFTGCITIEHVTIGPNVTTIKPRAFSWCAGLTSVSMPDTVKTIGEEAFSWCTGLREIGFSSALSTLSKSAFDVKFYNGTKTIYSTASFVGNYFEGAGNGKFTRTGPTSARSSSRMDSCTPSSNSTCCASLWWVLRPP